jgi:type II secretory pathway component HofQ
MLTQIAQLRQDLASLYQQALTISQQGGVIPTEMQQRISQYEQQIDRLQGQLDGTGGGQAAPTPPPAEEGPDEEWPDLPTVGPGGRITGPGSGRVVSEQPRMTLLDVLTRISEDTGEDIAVDATVKDQPITVSDLTGLSVPAALERILQQTEYTYKSQDGAYLVFKPITNTFSGDALRDALDLISLSTGVQISASANVVHDVYAQLEGVDLETALDKVLAGSPYVAKRFPNYYLVADRTFESDVFPEISVTRHVRLNYMSPQTVLSLLAPPFAQYVRAENAPDPNFAFAAGPIQQQNRGQILTITAAPKVAEQIVQQIKALDMRPRQVLLESRVVVLEHGDLLNLGVQWGFPTVQAGSFFGSILNDDDEVNNETMSGIQIGYTPDSTFTSALTMALNLLEETSQAEIMSNPQVFAQHGREAEIRVVTEEWFFMTAQQGDVFGFTRGELEKIESGTVLTITPFIGDNNDITLEMAVEVSDSIPRGRGSELPVVTRRTARNAVTIEDGGTVALAGLTENRVRSKEQRVPFLSDLPGVGGLFRNSDDDESTREIAVFVTANLVPERGRGGLQRGARRPEPSIREMTPAPAPLSMEDQLRDAMMRRRNR